MCSARQSLAAAPLGDGGVTPTAPAPPEPQLTKVAQARKVNEAALAELLLWLGVRGLGVRGLSPGETLFPGKARYENGNVARPPATLTG